MKTDDELMVDFAAGNLSAAESLFLRYKDPVYSWLKNVIGDASLCEDLYHDAWLGVIKNASKFKGQGFKAYFWSIVRNRTIDWIRKKRPSLILDVESDNLDGRTMIDDIEDDKAIGVLEKMEKAERSALLREAMKQLPYKQKEVLFLRVSGGLEFKEISAEIGVPLNTVLVRMHRAVAALKKHLLEREEERNA
jgi:RNA polymerase sigma-70 factor (ECF subfamily)